MEAEERPGGVGGVLRGEGGVERGLGRAVVEVEARVGGGVVEDVDGGRADCLGLAGKGGRVEVAGVVVKVRGGVGEEVFAVLVAGVGGGEFGRAG